MHSKLFGRAFNMSIYFETSLQFMGNEEIAMATLKIKNLHVEVEGKEILKGITTHFSEGETVALLGPNGHGKSTLLNVIMGHPRYKITQGSIYLDDLDLTNLSTDERIWNSYFFSLVYLFI